MGRDGLRRLAACALDGGAVAVGEAGRADPRVERLLVAPPREDQPLVAVVGRLEELEPLEAIRAVDGPGPRGEAVGEQLAPCRRKVR